MHKIFLQNVILASLTLIFVPAVALQRTVDLARQATTKPIALRQASTVVRKTDSTIYDDETIAYHEGSYKGSYKREYERLYSCSNKNKYFFLDYIINSVNYLKQCQTSQIDLRAGQFDYYRKQAVIVDYCVRKAGLQTPTDYFLRYNNYKITNRKAVQLLANNCSRYLIDKTTMLTDRELFPVMHLAAKALCKEPHVYYAGYDVPMSDVNWARDLRGWRLGAGLKLYHDGGKQLAILTNDPRYPQSLMAWRLTDWKIHASKQERADYQESLKFIALARAR